MSCDARPRDVYQCDLCGCQFQPGVADDGPNGEPRCPQCGLWDSTPVRDEDVGVFVVTRATKFR